jgi:hypothetical protein
MDSERAKFGGYKIITQVLRIDSRGTVARSVFVAFRKIEFFRSL